MRALAGRRRCGSRGCYPSWIGAAVVAALGLASPCGAQEPVPGDAGAQEPSPGPEEEPTPDQDGQDPWHFRRHVVSPARERGGADLWGGLWSLRGTVSDQRRAVGPGAGGQHLRFRRHLDLEPTARPVGFRLALGGSGESQATKRPEREDPDWYPELLAGSLFFAHEIAVVEGRTVLSAPFVHDGRTFAVGERVTSRLRLTTRDMGIGMSFLGVPHGSPPLFDFWLLCSFRHTDLRAEVVGPTTGRVVTDLGGYSAQWLFELSGPVGRPAWRVPGKELDPTSPGAQAGPLRAYGATGFGWGFAGTVRRATESRNWCLAAGAECALTQRLVFRFGWRYGAMRVTTRTTNGDLEGIRAEGHAIEARIAFRL
ncbi:MAG: hypothetical protein L0216_07680 [Planctomycetales bacterium]|nr:hypothetical protein [Planctomycetales bacterium]